MALTYKNSHILVTGGKGFIGSHLVLNLVQKNAHVIVVDTDTSTPPFFSEQNLHRKTKALHSNVCHFKSLKDIITKYHIDFIFHLAAQAFVEEAYKNPRRTLQNNILGTVNVLEAARQSNTLKAIIIASSDKAYGRLSTKNDYREKDALAGSHPYEVSKSCTDLIAQSYAKTYGLPVGIARFGNVYGEGDMSFSRLVPGMIRAMIQEKHFLIRSNGRYVRDYIHVSDVAYGYLLLGLYSQKVKGEAFNFGSHDTYSVLELIRITERAIGQKLKYTIRDTARNEISYQSLDFSKAKKILGWEPHSRFKEKIRNLYTWYEKHI